MENFSSLPTEAVNEATLELSHLPTGDALRLINDEDQKVAPAVRAVIDDIARAVDAVSERLMRGGRMIYVGAGTSGRLGVVDASECPPTFGTPPELVQGLIAGGREAMFRSQEGAEDEENGAVEELEQLQLSAYDCVIGIAASGRTPYVIGALKYARERGCFTAGVSVNPDAAIAPLCDVFIAPVVGPEALAGSTRMKAGTAQKLVLNMLSTGVMLRLGHVEGNLMADVRPLCDKLEDRAQRLVMRLANAEAAPARTALENNNFNVRAAVEWLQGRVDK